MPLKVIPLLLRQVWRRKVKLGRFKIETPKFTVPEVHSIQLLFFPGDLKSKLLNSTGSALKTASSFFFTKWLFTLFPIWNVLGWFSWVHVTHFQCIRLVYVRSSIPCINTGVRIELTFSLSRDIFDRVMNALSVISLYFELSMKRRRPGKCRPASLPQTALNCRGRCGGEARWRDDRRVATPSQRLNCL